MGHHASRRPSDVESPTKQAWERYTHLDHLLSGPGWLRMTTRDGMLCGVWRAVQAEHGGGDKRIGDQSKTSEG